MAISPNTNFTSGQILTATAANQWPRGVMQFDKETASTAGHAGEAICIPAISFTAVANRYYKISYFEPENYQNSDGNLTQRIRLDNVTGTLLNSSQMARLINNVTPMQTIAVETFAAGTVTIVGTMQVSAGAMIAQRTSTKYAFLLVEDIGTA